MRRLQVVMDRSRSVVLLVDRWVMSASRLADMIGRKGRREGVPCEAIPSLALPHDEIQNNNKSLLYAAVYPPEKISVTFIAGRSV